MRRKLHVDDPRQSVLAAIASAKGTFDAVVVLAYMSQDQLEQLAAALPEVDAVIAAVGLVDDLCHRIAW